MICNNIYIKMRVYSERDRMNTDALDRIYGLYMTGILKGVSKEELRLDATMKKAWQ